MSNLQHFFAQRQKEYQEAHRERDAEVARLRVKHTYELINSALTMFKEAVVAETLQAATVDATQGPNEQRALRYLDGFAALPFVSEAERSLIQAAKIAIRRARFQNLQRQINQLQRSTKTVKLTQAALADKLMQILRSYPLQQADDKPITSAPRAVDTTPDIILSESFDKRSVGSQRHRPTPLHLFVGA